MVFYSNKIVKMSYFEKCTKCGYEFEYCHKFQPGELLMTFPSIGYCGKCHTTMSPSFPPIGQLYIIEIDGVRLLQNEYLVNPKLRNEILNNMEKRKQQIKPIFFGLFKMNNLSKNEEVEFKVINENIKHFEERRKANCLTKEEEGLLRYHAKSTMC